MIGQQGAEKESVENGKLPRVVNTFGELVSLVVRGGGRPETVARLIRKEKIKLGGNVFTDVQPSELRILRRAINRVPRHVMYDVTNLPDDELLSGFKAQVMMAFKLAKFP